MHHLITKLRNTNGDVDIYTVKVDGVIFSQFDSSILGKKVAAAEAAVAFRKLNELNEQQKGII